MCEEWDRPREREGEKEDRKRVEFVFGRPKKVTLARFRCTIVFIQWFMLTKHTQTQQ